MKGALLRLPYQSAAEFATALRNADLSSNPKESAAPAAGLAGTMVEDGLVVEPAGLAGTMIEDVPDVEPAGIAGTMIEDGPPAESLNIA